MKSAAALLCIFFVICDLETLEAGVYSKRYFLPDSADAAVASSMNSPRPVSPSTTQSQPATNLAAIPTSNIGIGGYGSSYYQKPRQYFVPLLVPVSGSGNGAQIQATGYGSASYSGGYPGSGSATYSGSYPGSASSTYSGNYPESVSSTYSGSYPYYMSSPGYVSYVPSYANNPIYTNAYSSSGYLNGALSPSYPTGFPRINSAANLSAIPVAIMPTSTGSGVIRLEK